jgi:hypothetical protein
MKDTIDRICENAAGYALDWFKARQEPQKLKAFAQRFGKRARALGFSTIEALRQRPDLLLIEIDPKGLGYLVYSVEQLRQTEMLEPELDAKIQSFLKTRESSQSVNV